MSPARVSPPETATDFSKGDDRNHHPETLINCGVYLDGQRSPEKYTIEQAVEKVRSSGQGFVWLNIYEPELEYMRSVAKIFKLHRLLVEDAMDAYQRPKLELYNNTIFLVLKTFHQYVSGKSTIYEDLTDSHEIMILVGEDYVITIEYGDHNDLASVYKNMQKNEQAYSSLGNPMGVMYTVADYAVDSYLDLAAIVENKVEQAEQEIFSARSKVSINQIYKLKRDVLELRRAVIPLAIALQKLAVDEKIIVPDEVRRYFSDVLEHHTVATEEIASLDEVLNNLIDAALAKVSIQQNTDMRKISAWAGVGSVPTMIAGIYGMNFNNMPELHWKYGYYMVLGGLLLISFLLWYRFKKNDWL